MIETRLALQIVTHVVTEDFIKFTSSAALAFEVWAVADGPPQRPDESAAPVSKQPKSLSALAQPSPTQRVRHSISEGHEGADVLRVTYFPFLCGTCHGCKLLLFLNLSILRNAQLPLSHHSQVRKQGWKSFI